MHQIIKWGFNTVKNEYLENPFYTTFILPFPKSYTVASKIFMCCTPETYYL